jgi:DNA-binding HxlR family transcriptional regulator
MQIPGLCPRFHQAIELVGSRWTGAILQVLLSGRSRFTSIGAAIPDISDRMLSERLHALEREAIVVRTVIPESPIRVEYELTAKGRELQASLVAIGNWAQRWLPETPAEAAGSKARVTPARRPARRVAKSKTRTGARASLR